jgi:hypothetical protein
MAEDLVLSDGRHPAIVVDAGWAKVSGADVLGLDLTLLSGTAKGTVVHVAMEKDSAALQAALSALGVSDEDEDGVVMDVLGMPCTLVVITDAAGRTGLAIEA